MLYKDSITVTVKAPIFQKQDKIENLIKKLINDLENEHHIKIRTYITLDDDVLNSDGEVKLIKCKVCYTVYLKNDITLNHYKLKYPDFAGVLSESNKFNEYFKEQVSLVCDFSDDILYSPYVPITNKP